MYYPKAVVAFAGARDHYQLPLALYEGGLLHLLVTDLYWPADRSWFSWSPFSWLPRPFVSARFCEGLDSRKVRLSGKALMAFALMKSVPKLNLNRHKDKALGQKARRLALRDGAALVCCNYYGYDAFQDQGQRPKYRFLFQLHPHPKTGRRILQEELERVPYAQASLTYEHELSLPPVEFEKLVCEPQLANGWVVSSSYTARTLAEHGVPGDRIHVVPYGVDSSLFVERRAAPSVTDPFTVIFVGSLLQRKGLSYLLEAVRMLRSRQIRVVLCGRGFRDEELLAHYADLNVEVIYGLPISQLISEMHRSDVFVFPSLVEGFALVILEAMSCGLPVITTSHTCAPDVMVDGKHGFIVPIRDSEAIVEKLAWGMDNRAELAAMGEAAAKQARRFTWARFRAGVRDAYKKMIEAVR